MNIRQLRDLDERQTLLYRSREDTTMTRDELRKWAEVESKAYRCTSVAREILALLGRLDACERALRPFADAAVSCDGRLVSEQGITDDALMELHNIREITVAELRAARAALEDK